MDLIKYAGITLALLSFLLIIRQMKPEFAPFLSLSAALLFISAAAMNLLPTMDFLAEYANDTTRAYFAYPVKALGIGIVVQTTADICADAGENALASKIELLGRAELLLLALPLVKELLETAEVMINL